MKRFYYDLHIHSCLSPCGDNDMTPNNIVNMALLKGLDIIAVSDHNSALNCGPVMEIARDSGLCVIPSIEVCSAENIHALVFFECLSELCSFSELVYDSLPNIKNNPKIFGDQLIMDKNDNITGHVDKLLINACDIPLDKLRFIAEDLNGFLVPAHADKSSDSLLSMLGVIPQEYKTVELKDPDFSGSSSRIKCIFNSDAHYLGDINERAHYFVLEENTPECVLRYLKEPYVK